MAASWETFREQFFQLATQEEGLDHDHRLQASADLPETELHLPSPNADRLVYTIHRGRNELARETYVSIATKAGVALGFPHHEALSRWLEYVIHEAITERWREWWCPVVERHGETVSLNTGVLDFLCLASATACERLARRALAKAPQQQRASRRQAVVMPILTSRGWSRSRLATKAGTSKDSVFKYLSGESQAISPENRKAIADALGLPPEDLPE